VWGGGRGDGSTATLISKEKREGERVGWRERVLRGRGGKMGETARSRTGGKRKPKGEKEISYWADYLPRHWINRGGRACKKNVR